MTRNGQNGSKLYNIKKISKSSNTLGDGKPDIFSAENY